jgi:hypothetical protein
MNSITDLYRARQAASVASCAPPAMVCTTCGMLECLCRPRFFAGQVLNADDLNRLESYIRGKNRLHNRQLHGWGVVNGLEVTCNACGDGVTVSCGYALSPCGEDIVVCDAVTVDICALIQRCKDAERQLAPCDAPSQAFGNAACDADVEDWVLAIRYSESTARGVKPIYTSGCGCACGGSSGGACSCKKGGSAAGCGCAGKVSLAGGNRAKPRGAPVQCEPTIVCEGYEFEVYRAPSTAYQPAGGVAIKIEAIASPLLQRFECCITDLVAKTPRPPAAPTPQELRLWALRVKDFLLRYLQDRPGYQCALTSQLQTLAVPDPAVDPAGFQQAMDLLAIVYVNAVLACLCSSLLPPCPPSTSDERVPLAVVHVSNNPCRVQRICNWSTQRKFATTFPALQYWLSVTPLMRDVRELLEKLCCFDLSLPVARTQAAQFHAVSRSAPVDGPPAGHDTTLQERMLLRLNPALNDAAPVHDAVTLFSRTLFGERGTLTPQAIAGSLLGTQVLQGQQDAGGLSANEAAHLPQFLLLQQLVKPVTDAAGGGLLKQLGIAHLFGAAVKPPMPAEPAAASPADPVLATLRRELDELKAKVEAQAKSLATSKKAPAADRAAAPKRKR